MESSQIIYYKRKHSLVDNIIKKAENDEILTVNGGKKLILSNLDKVKHFLQVSYEHKQNQKQPFKKLSR